MYFQLAPGTHCYRGTQPDEDWSQVLQGLGAHFNRGGRYNVNDQRRVYLSDDPLVAVTETAFYQANTWQDAIGSGLDGRLRPRFPLRSKHLLWSFTIDGSHSIVDLMHEDAVRHYGFLPCALLNPGRSYRTTRELAVLIREHPTPARPAARGFKAPSVRTPRTEFFQPYQYVLFPSVPEENQLDSLTGALVRSWSLTIEFLDEDNRPVTEHTRSINWTQPRFRLSQPRRTDTGNRGPVPANPARPGAIEYRPGTWYPIVIKYA